MFKSIKSKYGELDSHQEELDAKFADGTITHEELVKGSEGINKARAEIKRLEAKENEVLKVARAQNTDKMQRLIVAKDWQNLGLFIQESMRDMFTDEQLEASKIPVLLSDLEPFSDELARTAQMMENENISVADSKQWSEAHQINTNNHRALVGALVSNLKSEGLTA